MKTFSEFLSEAKRRMRILRTSHYTSNSNKANIHNNGFHGSHSGTYHPEGHKNTVYTTPSSRVGNDYGHARIPLKIVNPKMKSTGSPDEYKKKIKDIVMNHKDTDEKSIQLKAKEASPFQQAREHIKKGEKIVRVPDAHENRRGGRGSYIMIDKDLANKSIDKNPQPTIRKKRGSR